MIILLLRVLRLLPSLCGGQRQLHLENLALASSSLCTSERRHGPSFPGLIASLWALTNESDTVLAKDSRLQPGHYSDVRREARRADLPLRVSDVNFGGRVPVVRRRKGEKDRVTMLRLAFAGPLAAHLEPVRALHQCDLARGAGPLVLPGALAHKPPSGTREWARPPGPYARLDSEEKQRGSPP